MRHRKKKSRLNRTDAHRKASCSMLAKCLFIHQEIRTTKGKAKMARTLVENLITAAKNDCLSSRRKVFSVLRERAVVQRLFKDIAPLFGNRVGGYTRIVPLGHRRGDGANMVLFELTEKIKEEEKPQKKAKEKLKKPKPEEAKKPKPEPTHKAGPEVTPEIKEEKTIEEVKKDKVKKEEKKIEKKGFFKRFFQRRTKM